MIGRSTKQDSFRGKRLVGILTLHHLGVFRSPSSPPNIGLCLTVAMTRLQSGQAKVTGAVR
jgi:hypothetical protein